MTRFKTIYILCLTVIFTSCHKRFSNDEKKTEYVHDTYLNTIFPKGEEIKNNNFKGVVHLQWLMTDSENFDATLGNVTFEPGCRNNWHSHPGGQILIVIAGEGYYQERGEPIRLIKKGDIIPIKADVIHWHGATPDTAMEHLAIGTRSHMGPTVWYEQVSDANYYSYNN